MATLRAERAFKAVVENGRSVSGAMRDVGYSHKTATAPAKLTKSKGWQELMDAYMPDLLLAKKHKEFLTSKRQIRRYKRGDLVDETEETDPAAVKALDMAYKLKRRYGDVNIGAAVILNISGTALGKYGDANGAPSNLPLNASVERVEKKDDPSIK